MTDWYRTAEWDEAARADFERRLRRARARDQYLRIKAVTLLEAGRPDDARVLLERLVHEHPDSFDGPLAHELLGDLHRDADRLEEAERHYRAALAEDPRQHGPSGMTRVALAELLTARGRARESWALLEAYETDEDLAELTIGMFNDALYRWLVARARTAALLGDSSGAARAAGQALDLVGLPDQYARHPGIGTVRADPDTLDWLTRTSRDERVDDVEGRASVEPDHAQGEVPGP